MTNERVLRRGEHRKHKPREYHGLRGHPLYNTWAGMLDRCNNPRSAVYHRYGGRGIYVCSRWANSFTAFIKDMGEHPADGTLDRIDRNGPYSPPNCRWATRTQQARNTSRNTILTFDGRSQCLSAWALERNLPKGTLLQRLKNGWSIEQALTKPSRGRAKLSDADVLAIRASSESNVDLAHKYNVDPSTISVARSGKRRVRP